MANELKTLKDIKSKTLIVDESVVNGRVVSEEVFISTKELKYALVEWYKHLSPYLDVSHGVGTGSIKAFIEHFGNLTKEDLK